MDKNLEEWVRKFLKENEESVFSRFIIREMGFVIEHGKRVDEETRVKAFSEFKDRTRHEKIAATHTMKRWFGLGGFSYPSRDALFHICFALKLSRIETERYLMQGLFEPSFQVNDYVEVFYFYGLENEKSYEETLEMISAYEEILAERFLEDGSLLSLSYSTKELKKELYAVRKCRKESFMLWMMDHANLFKGYSQTTQNYLEMLRQKIYVDSMEDARHILELRLSEIGYPQWYMEHSDNYGKQGDAIRVYLKMLKKRKQQMLSEAEYKNILELVRLVYAPRETNAKMYDLLYKIKTRNLPYLSEKHLSDLFHMPMHKIFLKNIRLAEVKLKKMSIKEECPTEILSFLAQMDDKKAWMEKAYSVGEALEFIEQYKKKEKDRFFSLHREELLPIIYYVIQTEYSRDEILRGKMSARTYFFNYGNSILNACGLEEINENYKLDALLIACLDSQHEYDYQDILYAVKILEKEME